MTMEQKATKNTFVLSGGLNTESSELAFPDGFTTDEANYDLLTDGSRRRRKGLYLETGGAAAKTIRTAITSTVRSQSFLWKGVGGDPTFNVMVLRIGDTLYFADEGETLSSGWYVDNIPLDPFETGGATTATVDDYPLSFASGRGKLLVTGQYLFPFFVGWDGANFFAEEIRIRIRDFTDEEDGVEFNVNPTTLTDSHRYNLRNRGWTSTLINTYYTGSGSTKYPSKAALWYRGYQRRFAANIAEHDGTQEWNYSKIANEHFGRSSAPIGSLWLEPHNSLYGFSSESGSTTQFEINDLVFSGTSGSYHTIVITTTTDHGLTTATGSITLSGTEIDYWITNGYSGAPSVNLDLSGIYAVTAVSGSGVGAPYTISFTAPYPLTASGGTTTGLNGVNTYGYVETGASIDRAGYNHDDSMSANAFYAGRGWYAGMINDEFADTVFFSQIVDTDTKKFGRCYQQNDPTDKDVNEPMSTDGGHLIIPGLSGVVNLVTLKNSLLILSKEGIWELSGARGAFSPQNLLVRKITEAGCNAADGHMVIDDTLIYTGPGGIYVISANKYTGLLEVANIIEKTILTKWTSYTTAQQERVQCVYDDAQKRLYFLIPDSTNINSITEALILYTTTGAWGRYTFTDGTAGTARLLMAGALSVADDPSTNKKIKFIYQTAASAVNIADMDHTDFDDWYGTGGANTNGPLPYLFTGWDNIGDFQRRRQAPIITVFSKRTETGYTAGVGWTPVNPSSTKMAALWDWVADPDSYTGNANEATTNKVGALQQVYRHVRDFVPAAGSSLDGYPVVVTRNKVRGRGRVLQLKFVGEEDYDSHILGFTTNYKVTRKI